MPAFFRGIFTILITAEISGCGGGGGVSPSPPPPPDGEAILAWGGNSSGELGDGTNNQRLNPAAVPLRDLRAIAAGGHFSLGLTMGGEVLEWGGNKSTPTKVSGLSSIRAIAVGERHRLALNNDGTVWAWGENDRGQLGDGSNTTRPTPVQVVGLKDVLGIAAGARHSLAIGKGFSVLAWGANDAGQLGDGSTTDRKTPVTVPGVAAISVAGGATHSVALTTDVRVLGWGGNADCQLGVDPRNNAFDPIVCSGHPQPILLVPWSTGTHAGSGRGTIAATNNATLVVMSDGSVTAFGGAGDPNFRGLCNSDLVLGQATLPLSSLIDEVAAGPTHVLFLTRGGTVWSLGANLAGQVGTGSATVQECPQEISSTRVRGATQLAAGAEHSLALVLGILDAQPATIAFGNQPVGTTTSSTMPATLTNTGLAPVTFGEIGVTNPEFTITETCPDKPATLGPGSTCLIQAGFTPASTGPRAGKIQVRFVGMGSLREIDVTGTGTEAIATFTPAMLDFGNQAVGGSSPPQAVTLSNGGAAPLVINDITATAGFAIQSDNCPRAPTPLNLPATCTINVVFTPTVAGAAVGEVRVEYAPNKTGTVQLKGNGV